MSKCPKCGKKTSCRSEIHSLKKELAKAVTLLEGVAGNDWVVSDPVADEIEAYLGMEHDDQS